MTAKAPDWRKLAEKKLVLPVTDRIQARIMQYRKNGDAAIIDLEITTNGRGVPEFLVKVSSMNPDFSLAELTKVLAERADVILQSADHGQPCLMNIDTAALEEIFSSRGIKFNQEAGDFLSERGLLAEIAGMFVTDGTNLAVSREMNEANELLSIFNSLKKGRNIEARLNNLEKFINRLEDQADSLLKQAEEVLPAMGEYLEQESSRKKRDARVLRDVATRYREHGWDKVMSDSADFLVTQINTDRKLLMQAKSRQNKKLKQIRGVSVLDLH